MLLGQRGAATAALAACVWLLTPQNASAQACPNLEDLRVRFLDHSTFKQAVESEEAARRSAKAGTPDCAVYCEAHQWISHTRAADFGWNMAERYSRFKKGMAKMDSLVNSNPSDPVLQALRLSVSGTAPRFLGEDTHWESDARAVVTVTASNFWAASPAFSEWMSELAADILKQLGSAP